MCDDLFPFIPHSSPPPPPYQVTKIMLHWVGHHFADFDTDDEQMINFLDRFEEYCKEDVSVRVEGGGGGTESAGYSHQLFRASRMVLVQSEKGSVPFKNSLERALVNFSTTIRTCVTARGLGAICD